MVKRRTPFHTSFQTLFGLVEMLMPQDSLRILPLCWDDLASAIILPECSRSSWDTYLQVLAYSEDSWSQLPEDTVGYTMEECAMWQQELIIKITSQHGLQWQKYDATKWYPWVQMTSWPHPTDTVECGYPSLKTRDLQWLRKEKKKTAALQCNHLTINYNKTNKREIVKTTSHC